MSKSKTNSTKPIKKIGGVTIVKGGGKELVEKYNKQMEEEKLKAKPEGEEHISNKSKKKKTKKKPKGRPVTHGLSNSPAYTSHRNMVQRCTNPNHPQYADYGGRGIECRISFEEMLEEIGHRPDGKSLDRLDPDGHYEKGNIRWASRKEQTANHRHSASSKFYKLQAIENIKCNAEHWKSNTRLWNLSIEYINRGGLYEPKITELKTLSTNAKLPRTTFDLKAPMDFAEPENGEIILPSLTCLGSEVQICCGPMADVRDQSYEKRGILAGLGSVPMAFNSQPPILEKIEKFIGEYKTNSKCGVRFTPESFAGSSDLVGPNSPERLFLSLASRLYLVRKFNVRLMAMSDVCERVESDYLEHLIGNFLFIPDFHVSGPKGYGTPPWVEEGLLELLQYRADNNHPTFIYAEDPWEICPELGLFIDENFVTI